MELIEKRQNKKTFNELRYRMSEVKGPTSFKGVEAWQSARLDFFENIHNEEIHVGYVTFRKYINGPFDFFYISGFTVLPTFRHRKQKGMEGGISDVGVRMLNNVQLYILLQNKILKRRKRFAVVGLNDGTQNDINPRGVWNFYIRHNFVHVPNGSEHDLFFPERGFTLEEYKFLKKVFNIA